MSDLSKELCEECAHIIGVHAPPRAGRSLANGDPEPWHCEGCCEIPKSGRTTEGCFHAPQIAGWTLTPEQVAS